MKCPHCRIAFHDKPYKVHVRPDVDGVWFVSSVVCPSCGKASISLLSGTALVNTRDEVVDLASITRNFLVYPKGSARPPCPIEVPAKFADDYSESCLVLADSPKASAALSRRCLQNLLREAAKVTPGDLYNEIEQVIQSRGIPTYISEALHSVRTIGNFGAHPIKSTSTGEIVDVEPGEAEWNLETLESLFDFYFVQPSRLAEKKAALNKKLQDAGKAPLS